MRVRKLVVIQMTVTISILAYVFFVYCPWSLMKQKVRERRPKSTADIATTGMVEEQKLQRKHGNLRGPNNERVVTLGRGERIINKVVINYDRGLQQRLKELISRKVASRDPSLISLIRELMDPPSKHMLKAVRRIDQTPQSEAILKTLNKKKKGFFVEAGGLDGERSSNTLFLENQHQWSGLLVEMDPYFYTQLLGKSRRCWSINACVSPSEYPSLMKFREHSGGAGKVVSEGDGNLLPLVPCFPLESMLLALNTTHVDYFSLDVEGLEMDILNVLPFQRLDISTLSVEYLHIKGDKEGLKSFMENKGYIAHKDINMKKMHLSTFVFDYIFVKETLRHPNK